MKKVLTLVLALVFVLALAAPAMAFTGDTTAPVATAYKLSLYLVEEANIGLFGGISLPAADRGYAKNELVAAVAELTIPKGENPASGVPVKYPNLTFSGKNVSFAETKNAPSTFPIVPGTTYTLKYIDIAGALTTYASDAAVTDTKFVYTLDDQNNSAGTADKTVKWLFFARVTGDDASLTVKLTDDGGPTVQTAPYAIGIGLADAPPNSFSLNGKLYYVQWIAAEKAYLITVVDMDNYSTAETALRQIKLFVDGDKKTTGMSIKPGGGALTPFFVDQVTGQMSIMNGAVIETSGAAFDAVKKVYDDIAVKVFGFNVALRGNYLRDKFFTDLVSNKTLVAKVDIKPWTAYVKVPDNVVVNPPKTGAAASILGFVMVALAGASAVALKKR